MTQLNRKLRRTLERARLFSLGGGMYPGDWWEGAPRQHQKLETMGLVRMYVPHNPVHKIRAEITQKGLEVLASLEAQEEA